MIDKHKNQYDFIYLSNIFYYIQQTPEQFSNFILNDIYPLLRKNGEAIIHYLYSAYTHFKGPLFFDERQIEVKSNIEEFHKYLNLNEYLVSCSGYSNLMSYKDVVLSIKR